MQGHATVPPLRQSGAVDNGEMIPWGQPIAYLIGGIMCYFVNGITAMVANSIGLEVGLDNMCKAFGLAGA